MNKMSLGIAAACMALTGLVYAADEAAPMPLTHSMQGMDPALMPQTAEGHFTMAESYKKKAAGYRQDAETHRLMLIEYKRKYVKAAKGGESPWVAKMRVHCDQYIKDADKLAADADEFGQFHMMRGKELQGQ